MTIEPTHYEAATAPRDLTCDNCGHEISEGSEYLKGKDENEVTVVAYCATPCKDQECLILPPRME